MSPGDCLVHERPLWPWVKQPYRLWSLVDVLNKVRLDAAHELGQRLEWQENLILFSKNANKPWGHVAARVLETLNYVTESLEGLPLSPIIAGQVRRLRELVEHHEYPKDLVGRLTELQASICDEYAGIVVLLIRHENCKYYDEPDAVLGETASKFPDSRDDLIAGCRCFALEEWTASVFHFVRAAESALQLWAKQLKVKLSVPISESGWEELLKAVTKKIEALQHTKRSKKRTDDLEYYGQTASAFRELNRGWRMLAAHPKREFNERRALDAMNAVSVFLRRLGERMKA